MSVLWGVGNRPGDLVGGQVRSDGSERLAQSMPGSPADRRPNFAEVIGSAESLVGRVSV